MGHGEAIGRSDQYKLRENECITFRNIQVLYHQSTLQVSTQQYIYLQTNRGDVPRRIRFRVLIESGKYESVEKTKFFSTIWSRNFQQIPPNV